MASRWLGRMLRAHSLSSKVELVTPLSIETPWSALSLTWLELIETAEPPVTWMPYLPEKVTTLWAITTLLHELERLIQRASQRVMVKPSMVTHERAERLTP